MLSSDISFHALFYLNFLFSFQGTIEQKSPSTFKARAIVQHSLSDYYTYSIVHHVLPIQLSLRNDILFLDQSYIHSAWGQAFAFHDLPTGSL